MSSAERSLPWFLWPFYVVWRLVSFVLEATGRVVCALLGAAILAIGVAVSLTVIGAPLGIPLAALGVLMLLRALF